MSRNTEGRHALIALDKDIKVRTKYYDKETENDPSRRGCDRCIRISRWKVWGKRRTAGKKKETN